MLPLAPVPVPAALPALPPAAGLPVFFALPPQASVLAKQTAATAAHPRRLAFNVDKKSSQFTHDGSGSRAPRIAGASGSKPLIYEGNEWNPSIVDARHHRSGDGDRPQFAREGALLGFLTADALRPHCT